MYFEVLVSIKEYKLKFYGFSKNVSSSVREYLRIYFYPGVSENVHICKCLGVSKIVFSSFLVSFSSSFYSLRRPRTFNTLFAQY